MPFAKLKAALLCIFLPFSAVFAQDSLVQFSAFVDIFYAYDFNKPIDGQRQYNNQVGRHNEFNLNHGFFMARYSGKKVRGEFGLQAGTYPDINNAHEPSDLYKVIYRANVGLKVHDKVWIDAGVFEGHFGYEVVETLLNENYSKAISAEYTPYYQAGVRGTIEFSKKVVLYLVILNGWQNMVETNDTKAFGMDLDYFPNDRLEINYGNYFGDEGDSFIGSKYRQFHEGYVKYRFTKKFHSVFTFDFGWQELFNSTETKGMYFFSLISEYKFDDQWSVATRLEHANDNYQILIDTNSPDGFVGQIYTATLNYRITKKSMFRIELKHYRTDAEVFNEGPIPNKNNTMIAASLAAEF